MKWIQTLIIFIVGISSLYGQSKDIKLEVSKEKALFITFLDSLGMEDPIERLMPGSNDYFVYTDIENNDNILRIQSKLKDTKPTNLVVITNEGNFYTFSLSYASSPKKLYYTITNKKSLYQIEKEILVENKEELEIIDSQSNNSYYTNRINEYSDSTIVYDPYKNRKKEYTKDIIEHYKKMCRDVISKNRNKYSRIFSLNRDKNIQLKLHSIEYNKDQLYFFLELKNDSFTDYIVKDFEQLIDFKNLDVATSGEAVPLDIVFIYNKLKRIKRKTTQYTVLVVDNFSINKRKQLKFILSEYNGERSISLKIDYKLINNPK